MRKILALCVATTMLVAGCGGGGDDGPPAPTGPIDPTNVNDVLNNIAVKIGGATTSTTSASNVPTASSDPSAPDPVSPDDEATTTTSSSSKANVPVTFEGEAICNIFAKIGSSALSADTCPGGKALRKPAGAGKARTLQTFIFEIELEQTFSATTGNGICFDIVAVDEDGLASEPVQICINLVSTPPENLPPVADAGSDQTTSSAQTVQLDGRDSYDPDGSLIYQWAQTEGPAVTLNGATTAQPTFTAPNVSQLTRLAFQLTVTDADNATSTDEVFVDDSPVPIQTGQLRFTLTWDADSDLDLYVQEPSTDVIAFSSSFDCGFELSTNGGCLDIDDVSGFGPENIIYESIPVNGTYCVAVDKFDELDPTSNYTLTVNLRGQSVDQFTGSLSVESSSYRWYVFDVDDGAIASRVGGPNDDPICPNPSGTLTD